MIMDIDAVIIEAEFEIESKWRPFGHYINLRFIDVVPNKPKLNNTLYELRKQEDIEIVNYHYTETPITKDTDIKYFDVTINQGGTNKREH